VGVGAVRGPLFDGSAGLTQGVLRIGLGVHRLVHAQLLAELILRVNPGLLALVTGNEEVANGLTATLQQGRLGFGRTGFGGFVDRPGAQVLFQIVEQFHRVLQGVGCTHLSGAISTKVLPSRRFGLSSATIC